MPIPTRTLKHVNRPRMSVDPLRPPYRTLPLVCRTKTRSDPRARQPRHRAAAPRLHAVPSMQQSRARPTAQADQGRMGLRSAITHLCLMTLRPRRKTCLRFSLGVHSQRPLARSTEAALTIRSTCPDRRSSYQTISGGTSLGENSAIKPVERSTSVPKPTLPSGPRVHPRSLRLCGLRPTRPNEAKSTRRQAR